MSDLKVPTYGREFFVTPDQVGDDRCRLNQEK
ncbi:MAG: hypothetical protein RLZZ464_679 [Pseudomonadota bacterium]|jgi:hypothetical protein